MKKILSLIALGCTLTASAQTYTLEQMKDSALHNNIAIRSAKYNIETAQQQRKEAFTKYFPNVSGTGLWFNANKGMAQTNINPSEMISPELGASLAQMLPALITKQDHRQALLGTAEYQLLGKQVEATNLQKKIAVGQNLPSVAVGVGYNYHNLLDNNTTFGMVFATVSVPISDWWGGSHAIKRRKIEHQKAVEQLEDNAQLLQIRMQNAWNGVEESYQQLLLAQRSIEQATENLRLNRNYYKAGTSKMSDLLEAQMLYQQSCDKRTDAFADYQNKLLEYRQAIGQ